MSGDRPPGIDFAQAVGALVAVGTVAALLGIASSVSGASHLLWLDDRERLGSLSAEVVASVAGRTVLALAATADCVLFTALAPLALALRGTHALAPLCAAAALGKLFALGGNLMLGWDGWYYALDPTVSSPALLFVAVSGAQAIGWAFIAVRAVRDSPA